MNKERGTEMITVKRFPVYRRIVFTGRGNMDDSRMVEQRLTGRNKITFRHSREFTLLLAEQLSRVVRPERERERVRSSGYRRTRGYADDTRAASCVLFNLQAHLW